MKEVYEFDARLHEIPEKGGAYIIFPWDIKEEFGKGRLKVLAWFDGIEYEGSIENMGIKDEAGNICYILGVKKSIRQTLRKRDGDILHVIVKPQLYPWVLH